MQTFDGILNRLTFSLVLLLAIGSISACDDNTIVSGNLSPDDVVVNADTILINDASLVKSPAFSGNRIFFTTGEIDDPIFGTLNATALIQPSIIFEQDVDTIGPNAVSRLSLNVSNIYGSQTEPADFEIVEVGRNWRSTSWRYDSIPDLTDRVVGQFTVTASDSISVQLNDEWTQRYLNIFHMTSGSERDSIYRNDMPGLAIVPAVGSSGKMFSVEADRARLVIEGGDGLPKIDKGLRRWGVSLSATGHDEDAVGTSKPVYNIMSSMLKLDLDLSEEFLGTNNFSRVELVLYADTIRMNAAAPQLVRPGSETIRVFYLEPDQINYAITEDPRFQVNRREGDSSYRINLTNFAQDRVQNSQDPRNMYIVIGTNDGRVVPMLLNSPDDPGVRKPKILITSISQK